MFVRILLLACLSCGVFSTRAVQNGLDYAFPPRPTAASVKAAGYTFVVRYVGGSSSKQITATEANELKAAGVDLILVFESTANRMLSGQSAGVTDANTAISQATAAGAPPNFFCYFACDFDAQVADQTAINAYLDGVASVFGGYGRIGFYGGYYSVKRVLDAGKAAKGWQTLAWSGGLKDSRISLYQTGKTVVIDGATCDVDEGYTTDLGQWSVPRSAVQVSLQPSSAAAAGAQWRVDAGPWQNSGAILRGFGYGNHTISFKPATGWISPAAITTNLTTTATASVTGTYTPATGSLLVTLGPSGANNAGAQWNLDSGAWQNSGATLSSLTAGNHTVAFKSIEGWVPPQTQSVSIVANQTTTVSASYLEATSVTLTDATVSSSSDFQFTLRGPVGNTYVTQASPDLINWTPISTNTVPAGGEVVVTDPNSTATPNFFRAVRRDAQ